MKQYITETLQYFCRKVAESFFPPNQFFRKNWPHMTAPQNKLSSKLSKSCITFVIKASVITQKIFRDGKEQNVVCP